MNQQERRQFVDDHRTCVFGYVRRDHGPAMTVVRCATFETPPRHVYVMSDIDTLTHFTSMSLPW